MKYGYTCKCGWQLNRGNLTRQEYAEQKRKHALKCEDLSKELEQSKRVATK